MQTHRRHAVRFPAALRALAACTCSICAAGLLLAVPAQGQVIEEGFPAKRVLQDEPVLAPAFPEECDAFAIPDEFGEGCREGSEARMPETFGGIAQGTAGFPDGLSAPSDPVLRSAPFIECPAAVFIEEMETGSIDCEAWDEAGEEHIDYYWEPAGGAPQDYLDAPRLIGEDRLVPSIVAPSSPSYATLESFLSEEATLRYRYRLTALSRVTGLSSQEEVEVFVLLRRPSVYCPLEYEVPAGSEVVLSCEGADPLSFRMDYEEGSSVSWKWEGLWGASASLLSGADTPSPSFRAPLGGSGETYDYVASMTTTSSGVPRTARRRVSVRVVEAEKMRPVTEEADLAATGSDVSLSANNSAPTITCVDYDVYPTAPDFTIHCSVTNEPAGAAYGWTSRGAPGDISRLKGRGALSPTFSMKEYNYASTRNGPIVFEYTVTLSAPGIADVADDVTVTILKMPDIMDCKQNQYSVYAGDPDFQFDCSFNASLSGGKPTWVTALTERYRLDVPRHFESADFKPTFDVPGNLPWGQTVNYYEYYVCLWLYDHEPDPKYLGLAPYRIIESEYITVRVLAPPKIRVRCRGNPYRATEGADDFDLECEAWGAPEGSAYAYAWTPRGSTAGTGLLSATNVSSPTFNVPYNVYADKTYEYRLTVSAQGIESGSKDVTIKIFEIDALRKLDLACAAPDPVYERSADIVLKCSASGGIPSWPISYAWTPLSATADTSLLSATNVSSPTFEVPDNVDADETYEYRLKATASWAEPASADVAVTVLAQPGVTVTCSDKSYSAYERSADIVLNCSASGAPDSLAHAYAYAWEARGATTGTGLLSARNVSSPTFKVPYNVYADETYEYRLKVSVPGMETGWADVTVTVLALAGVTVACPGNPYSAPEGSPPYQLDCSASGAPAGADYTYAWSGKYISFMIEGADSPRPKIALPEAVSPGPLVLEYRLKVSAPGTESGIADVTLTVLDLPAIALDCDQPEAAYEGSGDVQLSCEASGGPPGTAYDYEWLGYGVRQSKMRKRLSNPNIANPTFAVPDNVRETTRYATRVLASAANMQRSTAEVSLTVLDRPDISVSCAGDPYSAYEGANDIALSCSASGAPSGSAYAYAWSARGSTPDTQLLSATDAASPVFAVPDEVSQTTRYEYQLSVTAPNAEEGSLDVTVTVLNTGAISFACANPDPVYEGSADVALSCEASGGLPGAEYAYVWEARGGTPPDMLSATDIESPMFAVPKDVPQTTRYAYDVTVTADRMEDGTAEVVVTVMDKPAILVACSDPSPTYEGSDDFSLDCEALGAPDGSTYSYVWSARGSTQDTGLLSATNVESPAFYVPDAVDATTRYEYRLSVAAENAQEGSADVTVTVLDRADPPVPPPTTPPSPPPSPPPPTPSPPVALALTCTDVTPVYEGAPDIALDCEASGAPEGSAYEYVWEARGSTADTDLLSATDIASPLFDAPDQVDRDETYEYRVTVSAENADDAAADVTVTVLNKGTLALVCDNPASVYEGSPDIALSCEASGAPEGSAYKYVWEARGPTADMDLLSAADIASPLFAAPDQVDRDETYEYRVTVSAENADDATADVTVTVLDRGASPPPPVPVALALTCANPAPVYEGSPDVALSCEASGAPEGSTYEYVWESRGAAADTDFLSAADIASPLFDAPDQVDRDETYEYRVTVSAENAEDAAADVTVTVLNKGTLSLTCTNPAPIYEGSPDVALSCEASGAPEGSAYEYVWEPRGAAAHTDLLSAADIASPLFDAPDQVDRDETYEYRVTVSAENAEPASAQVTVTVLNKGALALTCANPAPVYEGSPDIALSCEASGAPEGSTYEYVWEARGATANTDLLSAADIASPMFAVPDEVSQTMRYEYGVTASADNAELASAQVTVTVLNKGALTLTCATPDPVYEGSPDVALSCEASGAPEGSTYEYVWEARGAAADTDLLSAADVASPLFDTPDEVSQTTRYEYRVTASAENAEDATADVIVTVLDRPESPAPPPAVAFSADPTSIGVRASASALRFGAQSADTEVSLDPLTDQITTRVSGPHHAGRMTLAAADDLSLGENGEAALSIELVTPASLRREGSSETLALAPRWSYAASCDQQASESIGGSFMQATLSESDCRLLLFGGDLDMTEASPGRYSGNIEVVLRTSAGEETRSVEAQVTVVPAARVITVGPGGVRFDASRKVPSALTEEQNLSIYPDVAFLTADKPSGAFELSNPSLMPLEVSVSARFGYAEATEDGRETVVEDAAASPLGDLSEIVDIYPSILTLTPGEQRVVRYGIREEALASMQRSAQRAMEHKGYAAFFDVSSSPRQYARADQLPEDASEGRTAHVTMRMPGAYAPDASVPRLRAELLSLSAGASPSATFLVETEDFPFAGEAVAYDREGRELGRSETLIYTRSRVRVSLERLPEDETVFLRFAPRGSGRLSAPVSVPWSAQGQNGAQDGARDIGAAQDGARDSARDGLRDTGAAAQDDGTPTPDVALAETP